MRLTYDPQRRARVTTRDRVRARRGALRRRFERAGDLAPHRQRGARGAPAPRRRRTRLRSARAGAAELESERFERVWIALHGPGGEDGTLQGALEYLGRALHRQRRHGLGDRHGQAAHQATGARRRGADVRFRRAARARQDFAAAIERLGLPLIVKPATQGSSVGMTKVERAQDLAGRLRRRRAASRRCVFAEAWLTGARVHRRDPAGRRAALDPHRDPEHLLRLRGEVLPRRHPLLLPLRTVARQRRGASGEAGARRLRGLRRRAAGGGRTS